MVAHNIRDLNLNDLATLEKRATFPMPKLNNKLYCIKKSIDLNDEIAAVFWVKLTSELSLIINDEFSSLKRAYIMKLLDDYLIPEAKNMGIDDTHLFIKDPQFAKFLVRNFNFEEIPGVALFRRL